MVRIRIKTCDRCQHPAEVLYRIQLDRAGEWQFMCNNCWQLLDRDRPDYVYGGTWKARKQ
jgi:hypothetical protein